MPMCKSCRVERLRSMPIQLFLLALGALWIVPTAAFTAPSFRCSLVPVATGRHHSVTFLVGRAQPDTLLAGPGTVRHEEAPGHWGRPQGGPIFGQVVRVDRLGGNEAASLESAFRRLGVREVIVVPWDYDPACQPVAWGRSARWVESTEPGFFRLSVRPESLWVAGRPVLDAFAADLEPYPHALFFRRGYRGTDALRREPSLSPDEYFGLYGALPDQAEAARDPAGAVAALEAWARAHPELAAKYPAPQVLQYTQMYLNR